MDMGSIYLTDITGTLGEWLDSAFEDDVPNAVIDLLSKAYNLAVEELNNPCKEKNTIMTKPKYESLEEAI